MAGSWKEAKESADRKGLTQVYHDCDDNIYGACGARVSGRDHSKAGIFIEHRCLCMPARLSCEELEEKERKFRQENPDW